MTQSGRSTTVVLFGIIVLILPAVLTLAQAQPLPHELTQTTPEPPILNLTDTPTSAPTSTSTPTPTVTPTPSDNTSTESKTFVVDDGVVASDCPNRDFQTIQQAVNAAKSGDTVVVCSGTYTESVEIPVDKSNLTIAATNTVLVRSLKQPAFWSNASSVTIRGFDIHTERGVEYAILVGGEDTVVRDNTIDSTRGVGIFLSDGLTNKGESDPELGTATGSRVVNNTVQAYNFRIWADADGTVIRNNTVSDRIETDPERQRCDDAREPCESANHSIVSTGNTTVIRNNTIRYTNHRPTTFNPNGTAILVGGPIYHQFIGERPGHNWATRNTIVGNSVSGAPETAIQLLHVATAAVVRNNTLTENLEGIRVWSNETLVRNNTVTRANYVPFRGIVIVGEAKVIENTITLYSPGLVIAGNAEIRRNTIQNNAYVGVFFTSEQNPNNYYPGNGMGRVVNNAITGNGRFGIWIEHGTDPTKIEIHRNVIRNNGELGIFNENPDKSDGRWPIVNATNNVWGCGGPSSGGGTSTLADPFTGRPANGTGDAISASDEPGLSNVHFDPFLVSSDCPALTATPTPTPTQTPAPTLTATPTRTPTDLPRAGEGESPGTGESEDAGTGEGEGAGVGENGSTGTGGGSMDQGGRPVNSQGSPTPLPSPTPTPTASSTVTPTPVVEPGFAVGTWIVGIAVLLTLLAVLNPPKWGGSGR